MDSIFIQRLSEELRKNRITQKALANNIGITEVSISRYMNGFRVPRSSVVANIAAALHVSTDYLLGISSDPGKSCNFHSDYTEILRLTRKCAPHMSKQQKLDIIELLL